MNTEPRKVNNMLKLPMEPKKAREIVEKMARDMAKRVAQALKKK